MRSLVEAYRSRKVHDHAVAGGEDADGRGRVLRHQGVDLGVRAPRVVVEQRELPGAGALRQCDLLLNSRVTEKAQPRQLGRGVLGIVH